jgi:hypothetical protein
VVQDGLGSRGKVDQDAAVVGGVGVAAGYGGDQRLS